MATHYNRRQFIQRSLTAGAGAMAVAGTATAAQSLSPATLAENRQVPTRPFGASGIQVSILSLGGMFDIGNNQLMLRQALKWGVTYWDTADCYGGGRSESGIGKYFQRFPQDRAKVFLVTKSDSRDPKGMSRLLERSLERMQTDTIDLYLLHGIRSARDLDDEIRVWAEQAKSAGKIKLFGFSTHSNMERCLSDAAQLGWVDGIMMTYNYRLMQSDAMRRAVEACTQAGIGLTAMKTQGGGSVAGSGGLAEDLAGRFLTQGFSEYQAKLKAVWHNPQIAAICSQMPNMTILSANSAAAMDRTELQARELESLQRYARQTESLYCAGCADICENALGEEALPVADVLRYLMYRRCYGDPQRARAEFQRIPRTVRQTMARMDYAPAEAVCPRKIPIGRLMAEALERLA
ncbi:MAG: aldo/keto reductase [Desulfobacterales bacterium]